MIPDEFRTARLHAERLVPAHYDELRVFHQDAQMMAMIGGLRDPATTVTYLDRHLLQWRDHGFGFFLLRDGATGKSVGTAGLRWLKLGDGREVEVGYGFVPACWGRGLATEVAQHCVALAFDTLAAPSVVAIAHPGNRASHHVLNKVGLTFERDVDIDGRTSMLFRGPRPDGSSR
jgi:RimJ/RimL family protein N-acetyltransferase